MIKKDDLASLWPDVDDLDIYKLEITHADLSQLSDVVKKWLCWKDCTFWIG